MVDIKKIAVVSGIGNLQQVTGVRNDGIIVEDYETKTRQFIATRKTNFILLEGISIYTDNDGVSLAEVLTTMRDKYAETPPPSEKSDSPTLRNYFLEILPNYDRERFHTSDMKKIIKWFGFLKTHNLLADAKEEELIADTKEEEVSSTEPKSIAS